MSIFADPKPDLGLDDHISKLVKFQTNSLGFKLRDAHYAQIAQRVTSKINAVVRDEIREILTSIVEDLGEGSPVFTPPKNVQQDVTSHEEPAEDPWDHLPRLPHPTTEGYFSASIHKLIPEMKGRGWQLWRWMRTQPDLYAPVGRGAVGTKKVRLAYSADTITRAYDAWLQLNSGDVDLPEVEEESAA